ncbi:hypothetical protein [Paenibacillus elgii]|uniref:hypothetical protein n=1 Tax=Paenibacillus elgii TaxID=189691 RepID=UPI000248D77E|nr:hypothetical protein [Paenibacillus elgii]
MDFTKRLGERLRRVVAVFQRSILSLRAFRRPVACTLILTKELAVSKKRGVRETKLLLILDILSQAP